MIKWAVFILKMIISQLNLTNFRNYHHVDITFSPHMNIIIGNNAVGKTNILEAISVLALTKSYRNGNEMDMIRFGKMKASIKGKIQDLHSIKRLGIEITTDKKTVKVNNTVISKISEYISNLNVVIFTPDDLEIIKGSPTIRRNLLNMELSQLSEKYLVTYNEYNKILKTRNEYLKILYTNQIADQKYLDILTQKLVEKAVFIYQLRSMYIDKINQHIDHIFQRISGDSSLMILYTPNIMIHSYETELLTEEMLQIYSKNRKRELAAGMTLYGPHRDDFSFFLKNNDMKIYASQGQQKSAVLAYKLATIPIFKEYKGTNPVLLLDDIFSELDINKKNKLLRFISKDIQSIITTTDLKNISRKSLVDATVFQVNNGVIEERS